MNYGKYGPGPASINIRDGLDPKVSFSPKKELPQDSGFGIGDRQVCVPLQKDESPFLYESSPAK